MITERTLKRWRRDALARVKRIRTEPVLQHPEIVKVIHEQAERILLMTQELMDSYLLNKEVR